MSVDEDTFETWEQWTNPMLDYGLGGETPSSLNGILAACHVGECEFRPIWEGPVEIVYSNLFTAVNHDGTMRLLKDFALRLAQYDIHLPPAELLQTSPVAEIRANDGWGASVEDDEVKRLRALRW